MNGYLNCGALSWKGPEEAGLGERGGHPKLRRKPALLPMSEPSSGVCLLGDMARSSWQGLLGVMKAAGQWRGPQANSKQSRTLSAWCLARTGGWARPAAWGWRRLVGRAAVLLLPLGSFGAFSLNCYISSLTLETWLCIPVLTRLSCAFSGKSASFSEPLGMLGSRI